MRILMTRRWSIAALTNYWGYQTIGFFAPHAEYASNREPGAEVVEFKGWCGISCPGLK